MASRLVIASERELRIGLTQPAKTHRRKTNCPHRHIVSLCEKTGTRCGTERDVRRYSSGFTSAGLFFLATPSAIAVSATALATAGATFRLKTLGMM
jgi:hypothetical protein